MNTQFYAVYCSVLQCAEVCCSVLQCVAARCGTYTIHHSLAGFNWHLVFIRAALALVCCSVLQCVALCCSAL